MDKKMQKRNEEHSRVLAWCKGDRAAADFLMIIGEISQIADDFVDRDVPEDQISGARMLRLLHLALVDLPANPFYARHQAWFRPLFSTSLLIWEATGDWEKSDKPDTRIFAYAYREICEQIFFMAANIIGGMEHARQVVREVHDFYHVEHAEDFKSWEKENCHG
jgi:hypothetical protein